MKLLLSVARVRFFVAAGLKSLILKMSCSEA